MTEKMPIIVVVDDSTTSISLYQFSLEPLGIHFQGFTSPLDALPYLAEHTPDLIFLDIIMPGMDGLTFLQKLRDFSHQKTTPVVMVTSKDYAQDRYIAKQLGALDFLIKPLRFKEIRALVYQHATRKPPALNEQANKAPSS
ncbi:response regulator [Candidatus Venteria ishoeyi]|uniref:response regulator n=1 Tax=Candidatus Venteria ishoeyi TaxID=1899563 RepID=UPI0025A53D84|nr:response regulator [Candidatus Venteria ishoeyi]MDM8546277.1 response regulator [Candidatus Venteria ishoeyi]